MKLKKQTDFGSHREWVFYLEFSRWKYNPIKKDGYCSEELIDELLRFDDNDLKLLGFDRAALTPANLDENPEDEPYYPDNEPCLDDDEHYYPDNEPCLDDDEPYYPDNEPCLDDDEPYYPDDKPCEAVIINLTPHDIVVRDNFGVDTTYPKTGTIPRVETLETPAEFWDLPGIPLIRSRLGAVIGLPDETPGSYLLVSRMVLDAAPEGRRDLLAPDSGPTAIRDARGQVVAVTRLICK